MKQIYHRWEKWECFKNGFYETLPPKGLDKDAAKNVYAEFLSDIPRFEKAIERVFDEWPNSCEHWLTNGSINRIAWLGQASLCIETGIPSVFRGGFKLLSLTKQQQANLTAEKMIKNWEMRHGGENKEIYKDMESKGLF